MQAFVPLSDQLLYEHPERADSPCRPCRPGVILVEWLPLEEIELTGYSCPGIDCEDSGGDC